ncbi:MAG TPA: acetyl-CoA acetyltransferase [Streptosporangiaceae bacterium]|jgi:acetyl-CoA acetyltransferase
MSARQGFAGRAAVAGVGMTPLTRRSGRTELDLAVAAARAALDDAGLAAADIDAVLSYHMNDSAPVTHVARELGAEPLGWHNDIHGGGTQSASILGDAAMLIDARVARTVLVYRALNGRSGVRMNAADLRLGAGTDFTLPYGLAGPVAAFALVAQRYLAETGLGADALADVVIASRRNAAANPRALRREPLDRAAYDASPMVASPLRRADCCQETDGACALVLTAADHPVARGAPRVHAVVRGGGPGASDPGRAPDPTRMFSAYVAAPLYAAAGMRPADIDVALLYDAYSFLVPVQLADFGLVARADLPDVLRALAGPRPPVPVNPHGGLLSEGYVHGLNNVAEAVRQLRGDGVHQVPDAEVALCTGFGGSYGSAAVLIRDR